MTIVRRQGFSNDQWTVEGANLLSLRYRQAGVFSADASQIVHDNNCPRQDHWTIDRSLRALDAHRYRFE
jgi:hypothetical protein